MHVVDLVLDDDATNAAVADQDVGARTQHEDRRVRRLRRTDGFA